MVDIPKMAERQEALRLYNARVAAEAHYDKALADSENADDEISRKYTKLREELDEKENAERGLLELYGKFQAARDAYKAHPEEIEEDWKLSGYAPLRCAKTGHVILESDETVKDHETGEVWLRAALGLSPRPVELEEAEAELAEAAA